jgi:hypothetical protein
VATPKTAAGFLSVLLTAFLMIVSFASNALAARSWGRPVDLAKVAHDPYTPGVQVALTPDGDAMAVWQNGNRISGLVQAASKPTGGSWSAPVDISEVGHGVESPHVGLDAAGNATAIWESSNGPYGPYTIQAASKPAGGSWSAPVEISGLPLQAAIAPQLAVNPHGDAIAVWVASVETRALIRVASKPAGGSWSAPVDISDPATGEGDSNPRVALDAAGDTAVVWSTSNAANAESSDAHYAVQAASKPAGGSWSAPVDISSPGEVTSFPKVALDDIGNATALWVKSEHLDETSTHVYTTVQAASKPAGGSWSAPVEIAGDAEAPGLAVDAAGDATTVWWSFQKPSGLIVQAASKPAGGSWSAPVDISAPNGPDHLLPQVSVNSDGDAVVVWESRDGIYYNTQAASKPAGGSWSAPVDISEAGTEETFPQVALDAAGNATAVWERFNGTDYIVQAADFNEELVPGPPLTLDIEEGSGTVVTDPGGFECAGAEGESCTIESIAEGTVVLTASPAPGYLFKNWRGCDRKEGEFGTNGRQCTIDLSEAKTVGVRFIKVWSLKSSKLGDQGIVTTSPAGINCSSACISSTALYKEGTVTVKSKSAKNFHFLEFANASGSAASCNGESTETCSFSMTEDSAIEALYAEDEMNTLTLSKVGGGQGSVKTTPSGILCGYTCGLISASFYQGEMVEVKWKLGKGTSSLQWATGAGNCDGTTEASESTCTVPMSEAHELVARFE